MAAKPQETPDAGDRYDDATTDASFFGCCCFRQFCFGRGAGGSYSHLLNDENEPQQESWLVSKAKKVRELSELAAGPKWKNLLRKMGRICNCKRQSSKSAAVEFHYSPESYALNFAGAGREEDGELLHSFSTRFASGFNNDRQRL